MKKNDLENSNHMRKAIYTRYSSSSQSNEEYGVNGEERLTNSVKENEQLKLYVQLN
ncbi:MAG: hypothetical protein JXR88_14520 [Clostridia bacterium]|nr:hypothetical protein [Clostridia bacterium]